MSEGVLSQSRAWSSLPGPKKAGEHLQKIFYEVAGGAKSRAGDAESEGGGQAGFMAPSVSLSPSSPLLCVTLGSQCGLGEQHRLGQDIPHFHLEVTACVTFYRSHCLSPQTCPKGFHISPKPAFTSEKGVKSTHTGGLLKTKTKTPLRSSTRQKPLSRDNRKQVLGSLPSDPRINPSVEPPAVTYVHSLRAERRGA